jgi:Tfp pilus assembly protein PilE
MKWLMKILGKRSKNRARFMLVALVMDVTIVSILTAAALPVYTSFGKKAYTSEASASLGAIKTAENVYYMENGRYTADWDELGMTSDDFKHNRWFEYDCFGLYQKKLDDFTAVCNGDNATATQVHGIYLKLSNTGDVTSTSADDMTVKNATYLKKLRSSPEN